MNMDLFENKINLILIAGFLTIIISVVSSYVILISIVLLIIAFISYFNNRALISILILSYIAISGQFFDEYRLYITLLSTILLLIIFLKEYGINTDEYAKIPKGVLSFIILLFITLLISVIFSQDNLTSFFAFIRTLVFFLITYMFFSLLKDEQYIYTFIYSILFVLLVLGIPMLIDLINLGFQGYFIRILLSDQYDLYSSKGYTGYTIFFISIVFITVMFFIEKFKNRNSRILLTILLLYNIIILILANSRGGIVAALIGIIFFFLVIRANRLFKYMVYLAIAIIILFLVTPVLSNVLDNYMRIQTISDREVYWRLGVDIINEYPLFGVGADMFDKYFYTYAPSSTINFFDSDIIKVGKPHPHNIFLYYFAENGFLGLITAISFFAMFFYYSIKTIKLTSKRRKDFYFLSLGITGIGIGLFFRSFFEVTGFLTYGYISRDLPFWLIFAILISIYQRFSNPSSGNRYLLSK
jgi:O-antigen ligase